MSTIKVDNISNRNGDGPVDFPNGITIEGGPIEAGGSGDGKFNYIENPFAKDDTSGQTTSLSSGLFSIARTTTASELPSTKNSAWKVSGSGVTVGDYIEFATQRAISATDTTVGSLEIKLLDLGGSAETDWALRLYDLDNSQYVSEELSLGANGVYVKDAFTKPNVNYAIRLIAKVASPAEISFELGLFENMRGSMNTKKTQKSENPKFWTYALLICRHRYT